MTVKHILVVEDDLPLSDAAAYALERDGYRVSVAATGEAAIAMARQLQPDLALLDIGLPDMSGWELGRILIQKNLPVVFMTSRQSEADRVAGLEMGGDDYIVKPFSPREMVARVRAVLRRCDRKSEPVSLSSESALSFDEALCAVRWRGKDLDLTRNEYRLLAVLNRRPGRVFSRSELLQLAWEDPFASQERTVDAHIKQLRAKLRAIDPDCDPIETRRGFGYSFSPPK